MVPASGDAHKNFHSPLAGIRSGIDNSVCGDAIKILHSRERRFCNNFAEMHIKIYIPPFAGIRSRIDSSACGNAIKILHPRKRRFCIYFSSRCPRAEMHIKILILPSREYDPESTVPLAGMQSKFYIPASGDFVFISAVHGPRERRCTSWNFHSPLAGIRSRIDSSACGNATKILHPRKRRFLNYFCARSPRAEMHMKIYNSPSREYYPAPTIPLAEMQLKYCISASGYFVIILVPVPAWGNAQ